MTVIRATLSLNMATSYSNSSARKRAAGRVLQVAAESLVRGKAGRHQERQEQPRGWTTDRSQWVTNKQRDNAVASRS